MSWADDLKDVMKTSDPPPVGWVKSPHISRLINRSYRITAGYMARYRDENPDKEGKTFGHYKTKSGPVWFYNWDVIAKEAGL